VGSSLTVQEVPGDHVTMLTGDNAIHLARLLRESIDSIVRRPDTPIAIGSG
jgi:hypothetical protein